MSPLVAWLCGLFFAPDSQGAAGMLARELAETK